ncbi:MBL fold metallo-hydrolase [Clostridium sp.]|uniref:ComEC/Rec2 family competence protein n=1 Tax=Clostridium sp. TaxID=1506 RepID=UPI00290BF110|nr:MBL fold metallo-hydrolase [Clostridium sp.]MDU6543065.1 MBL fold metallo-hydrolase [Clostridium sp.]
MKKLRNIMFTFVAVLSLFLMNASGVKAEWRQDSNGWWYFQGSFFDTGWSNIGGQWYYFGSDGYMKTGWINEDGSWYYLKADGTMAHDCTIDGRYINGSGKWIQQNNNSETVNTSVTGELKVHFIDVGQADSILIQQGNESMLIDAGNNDDENTLKNYLAGLGVKELKYAIATHPHEDHIGSMDYIMNSLKVGQIYAPKVTTTTKTYENLVNSVKNKGMQFKVPIVGETFYVGQAKCTILAPNSSSYDDLNDYSIVVKVEFGNNSFLFTGDAGEVSEKEMLSNGLELKADVLKVGHHGSRTSSSDAFLNTVNPKYAVISVGKDNDYGHPNAEALNRLSSRGAAIYRTDLNGTIVATSNGNNITFNCNPAAGSSNVTYTDNNSNNSNTSLAVDTHNDHNATTDQSQDKNRTVYVSRNNGKVYHYDKTCSGLKNPLEMNLGEAEDKGLDPCKKCIK